MYTQYRFQFLTSKLS